MEVQYPNEPPVSPRGKGQKMLTNIRNSLLIHHRPSSPPPITEEPDPLLLPEIDAAILNSKDIRRGMRRLSKKASPALRVSTQDLLGTLSSAEADKLQQENARTEMISPTDKQTPSIVSPSSDEDLDLSLADVDELFRKSTIRFSQISLNASIDFSETDSTTTSYVKRMSYFSNNSSNFTGTSVTSNDDSLSTNTDFSATQPLSNPILPDPYTAFGGRKSMTLAPSRRYSMPYHTLMAISSKRPYARTRVDTLSEIDWSRAIGTVNGKRISLPLLASTRDEDDLEHEKGFAGLGEEDVDGPNEKEPELNDVEHQHDAPIHHTMDEKTLRKRFNIAMEILDTERYYVESMMLVERAFLAPLLNMLDPSLTQNLHPTLSTSVSTPITPTIPNFSSPILSRKDINDIFANFVDIVSLNTEILRLLEARLIGPDAGEAVEGQIKEGVTWNPADGCLGDIFLNVAPFLKVYSNYVKNFNTALKTLSHCMQRNDRFRIFLAEQSHRENLRGLTIEGYLLMPVQRIPRYKLLLESLLGNTPSEHPDHEKLSKAFGIIEEVAMFVNEMIRQQEMFMTMLGIQKGLVGFDEVLLIPGRRLIKTGVIRKICRKSHQLRIFFLFSDILIYASPTFVEGSFTFHRKFKLDRCSAVGADDTDNAKNIFQILSPEKSFAVYAESAAEKESWINTIMQTKQELLDSMSTLRVDDQAHSRSTSHYRGYEFPVMLNYRAPVWTPDDATDNCQLCNEEFTLFRRKHHCRACGKVICYSCSTRNFIIPGRYESEDRLARACDSCFEMILEAQLAIELQRAARNQSTSKPQTKTIDDAPAAVEASVPEHTSTSPLPLSTIERRGSLENMSGQRLIRDEMLNRTGSGFLIKGQSSVNVKQPIRRSTTTRRSSAGKQCDLCGSGFGVFRWKHMCDKCHRTVCADCLSKKPITVTDIAELGMAVPDESIFSIKLCDPCHLGIFPGDVILREGGGWEVQEEEEEQVRPVHRRSMSGSALAPPEEEPCSVV